MNCLGLFAKHWTPGRVKTRLAATIGDEPAARLQLACLQTLLARCGFFDAQLRMLAFAPLEQERAFGELAREVQWRGAWRLWPQPEGDLGERLAKFFTWAFEQGCRRVVVIGADSPTLPLGRLAEAFDALSRVPVVLGPATDGGYWLVGAAGSTPPVFSGIDWGSAQVFRQTAALLHDAGLPYHVLSEWYDVDEPSDLLRLHEELRVDHRPEYAELRRELAAILERRDI